jgi:hypothetical protein
MARLFEVTFASARRPGQAGRGVTSLIGGHAMSTARVRYGVTLLSGAVLLSTVVSTAAADTTLRWKFAPGQKQTYAMTQKTSMKMELQGNPVKTSYTQTTDITWEVKAVDKDGIADMVQTIDRVRFEMMAPTGKVDVDTAKESDAPGTPELMSKLFRSMAGSPFSMKMTPRGEVRDLTVPAKLVDAFKNAGPAAQMVGSEESLKNLIGQSVVVFPEAGIAEGNTWQATRKLPMPFGTMVMDTTYTLEPPTGPVANIGINVKAAIEPKEGSPLEIKVTSQDTKGHYRFDNAAGNLKSSEVNQKMSMKLMAQGQEIAQDLESNVKMELKNPGESK